MSERSLWQRDGQDWPNRAASRFVQAAGLCWHVQRLGRGPSLLLVHGTGAATHSWRSLAPLLASHFSVLAPDLPGHGFTAIPSSERLSLPYMAGALGGLAGQLFAPLAKLLYTGSFVPRLFARRAADPAVIRRMLGDTGSRVDRAALELYGRLARNPRHVAAALGMMANWDLKPLERELPRLQPPLYLVAGTNDRMIRPAHAARVRRILPAATLLPLPGLGHLAHEEEPEQVAELITGIARTHGDLPRA